MINLNCSRIETVERFSINLTNKTSANKTSANQTWSEWFKRICCFEKKRKASSSLPDLMNKLKKIENPVNNKQKLLNKLNFKIDVNVPFFGKQSLNIEVRKPKRCNNLHELFNDMLSSNYFTKSTILKIIESYFKKGFLTEDFSELIKEILNGTFNLEKYLNNPPKKNTENIENKSFYQQTIGEFFPIVDKNIFSQLGLKETDSVIYALPHILIFFDESNLFTSFYNQLQPKQQDLLNSLIEYFYNKFNDPRNQNFLLSNNQYKIEEGVKLAAESYNKESNEQTPLIKNTKEKSPPKTHHKIIK